MSPGKRTLCIWTPRLPVNRFGRSGSPVENCLFAVTRQEKNAIRLICVNPLAQAAGLAPDMTLATARALAPSLISVAEDPLRDAAFLRTLQRWCGKFTPWSAIAGEDTLILNITGCAHLFGGEAALAQIIVEELIHMGVEARLGVADTKGASIAAAQFGSGEITIIETGKTRAQLTGFPIDALSAGRQTLFDLKRLGIKHIGDLYPLKSADLARRFGFTFVRAYEKLMGVVADPVTPAKATPTFATRLSFPDPIGLQDDVREALRRLGAQLCKRLCDHAYGLSAARLSFYRADKSEAHLDIGLARPTQEAALFLRQFDPKLDKLDAGAGIDMMRLSALKVEPFTPAQRGFADAEKQSELDALIATLGNRLGFDRILRWRSVASHLPRRSFRMVEAVRRAETGDWRASLARPLILLDEPIVAIAPGRPPKQFEWRRKLYTAGRICGPERIGPEWWRASGGDTLRDYWRVDSLEGPRFWLSTRPGEKPPRWEAAGLFP